MIDVGFLAVDFDAVRQGLSSLANRRLRMQGFGRIDEFLLGIHDVRAAMIIDADLVGGRVGPVVATARRLSAGKIIVLASDDHLVEASSAYEFGLDAVVSKKLAPPVVAAQIYNMALREQVAPRAVSAEIGDFRFDELSRQIVRGSDVCLRLTEKESQLLAMFLRAGSDPLARDQISMEIFSVPYQANDRRIDVHISNLRRKLRSAGVPFGFFPSRGGGYYGAANERLPEPAYA